MGLVNSLSQICCRYDSTTSEDRTKEINTTEHTLKPEISVSVPPNDFNEIDWRTKFTDSTYLSSNSAIFPNSTAISSLRLCDRHRKSLSMPQFEIPLDSSEESLIVSIENTSFNNIT